MLDTGNPTPRPQADLTEEGQAARKAWREQRVAREAALAAEDALRPRMACRPCRCTTGRERASSPAAAVAGSPARRS